MIKNYPRYVWRVFCKWLTFFVIGAGGMFLVFLVFPLLWLCCRRQAVFQRRARRIVSASFRLILKALSLAGVVKLRADRSTFARLSGRIIAANHPSILDVVILISLIPNADCIVNSYVLRTPLGFMVRRLYLPNSLDVAELLSRCEKSLAQGNCLIFFPEGTRTRRTGPIRVKKGAARLSVLSKRPVVLVRLEGNDKWGLGKKDPWWAFNHNEPYRYELTLVGELSPAQYEKLPGHAAVNRLHQEIKERLFRPLGRDIF